MSRATGEIERTAAEMNVPEIIRSTDEFKRLKRRDREVLLSEDLTEADLAAIASAEVPAEHADLDAELKS